MYSFYYFVLLYYIDYQINWKYIFMVWNCEHDQRIIDGSLARKINVVY